MILSQYTAHLIFKKNGLAAQYAEHPSVKNRSAEELGYLNFLIENPWRFSFCRVKSRIKGVLFEMEDLILNETFILFSPGVDDMLERYEGIQSFLFLIGYNETCWQTYSILNYFKGFQPFDFYFFARKIKSDIDFLSDVQDLVERDPLPFMMLYSGATFPITRCKSDLVVHCKAEYHVKDFEPDKYNKDFLIEKKYPIYMLSLKRRHGYPHFVKCYYHMEKHIFILAAMTQRGWSQLVETLNKRGYDFPLQPDIMVTPAMLAVSEALQMKTEVDPYGKLFAKEPSPGSQKELEKLNAHENRPFESGFLVGMQQIADGMGIAYLPGTHKLKKFHVFESEHHICSIFPVLVPSSDRHCIPLCLWV